MMSSPPQKQQQQPQRPAATGAGHTSGLPALHCEHGEESGLLLAAPLLSALPQLEPLSLEVGGPPPTVQEGRPLPMPPPARPPQGAAHSLLSPPPPRSQLPQDDVAGTEEDVRDVAEVIRSTGGGGGAGGAICKEGGGGGGTGATTAERQPQQEQQEQQHEPLTPAARNPHAPAPRAAAAGSSPVLRAPAARELPAPPPSSPARLSKEGRTGSQPPSRPLPPPGIQQSQPPPPAWLAASAARVASARPGVLVADAPAPAWIGGWPVTADQLLLLARDAVATGVHKSPLLWRGGGGEGGGGGGGKFEFSAPFVGPLTADAFASTMEEMTLDDAFDLDPRCYGFRVDPLESGRVWFTTRPIARFARPLRVGAPLLPLLQPTGGVAMSPPQTASLKFAPFPGGGPPDLPPVRVVEFTYGYCSDRRQGNTGGMGGAFGLLYWAGRPMPFPEGRPWASSWQQRLFNRLGPPGRAAAWLVDRGLALAWPWGAPTATARGAP